MVGEMSRDVEGLSGTFGFSVWNNCDIRLESLGFGELGSLQKGKGEARGTGGKGDVRK